MFFVQQKDDIYHVIVYFINYLINQDITSSVFACFNWALKIDFKELQFFMLTKNCKWKLSATYIQHQDETSEWAIQIILCWMRAVMIQTKLSLKLWAEIDQSVIYLTNISSTVTGPLNWLRQVGKTRGLNSSFAMSWTDRKTRTIKSCRENCRKIVKLVDWQWTDVR